jgi:hypothetical protein
MQNSAVVFFSMAQSQNTFVSAFVNEIKPAVKQNSGITDRLKRPS